MEYYLAQAVVHVLSQKIAHAAFYPHLYKRKRRGKSSLRIWPR